MKKYFVNIEYWSTEREFNRYICGVIYDDLETKDFKTMIEDYLKDNACDYDRWDTEWNVKAFNNVD